LKLVRDFDFDLPPELIAQEPMAERSGARLLYLNRRTGSLTHSAITALPALLGPGDLVVVNNTRVFPARLLGHRVPSGGAVECLLVGRIEDRGSAACRDQEVARDGDPGTVRDRPGEIWEALMHPGQKLKPGARVLFEGATARFAGSRMPAHGVVRLHGEVLDRRFYGRRVIRFWTEDGSSVEAAIDAIGHVPLPPYIKREDHPDDRERYQTMFASARGSVAAPTAGLHFSPALMTSLAARGVRTTEITLHVGYGTFQPVRVERVEDHRIDAERYDIDSAAASAINLALSEGRRVVAVGTTTTRALEAAARRPPARPGEIIQPGASQTDLVILPGFDFRVVTGLVTNFHLPRSSLLMLVSAFGGHELVMNAYHVATKERYRFYSYGDAMLIL
jgi:S-adenosylmethionine:tRNA ribosyltransferase-isomerase